MEKIIGRTFRNERVNLDFTAYEKCNFINCEIYLEYGITSLVNCDFSKCSLHLGGPAATVAKIMRLFFPEVPLIE